MGFKEKTLETLIRFSGQVDSSVNRALEKLQKDSKKTAKELKKLPSGFSALGKAAKITAQSLAVMGAVGAAALSAFAVSGYQAASDLIEVQNVVDTTFRDSAAVINQWSKTTLQAYGLSELSAKKYSSTMGAMLKSSGVSSEDLLLMSQSLTQLTGDMASFYNYKPDEMFEKIRSGISGETEPLKQLGINMSVANLEAFALSEGITKSYAAMSQAEQVTLRYNYLMKTAADSMGDFEKTSGSASNQQKLLKENISQVSAQIMQRSLPAVEKILKNTNSLILSIDTDAVGDFVEELGNLAVEAQPLAAELLPEMGNLVAQTAPVLLSMAKESFPAITSLLGYGADIISIIGPPLASIVSSVLPRMLEILDLIAPLVIILAEGLAQTFEWLAKISSVSLDGVVEFLKYWQSQDPAKLSNMSLNAAGIPTFAQGGFADSPSIFGEAGLEAAIPIKPGNRRSLDLLYKTAEMLGVQLHGGNMQFTYAPQIYASDGDKKGLASTLYQHGQTMRSMMEDFLADKERVSFG